MAVYKSDAVTDALKDAGVLPKNTRRVIIQASVGEPLLIYYECLGSEEHVAALSAENVAAGDPIEVSSITEMLTPGRLDLHYLLRTLHELSSKLDRVEYDLSVAIDARYKNA